MYRKPLDAFLDRDHSVIEPCVLKLFDDFAIEVLCCADMLCC